MFLCKYTGFSLHTHACTHSIRLWLLQGVAISNNTWKVSSCLLQPANYGAVFKDEGSIKEVPRSPQHSRLLQRQTLFFPACQCQEPIKEQWWGYNVGKQCKDGPSHCSWVLLLEKCPAVLLCFCLRYSAATYLTPTLIIPLACFSL